MNEFDDMIKGGKPTLVDFFATWCGPCKMQSPILDAVKAEVGDEANIIKVDVDRNQELAARYRICSGTVSLCGVAPAFIRRSSLWLRSVR